MATNFKWAEVAVIGAMQVALSLENFKAAYTNWSQWRCSR
jgi:hypothetical protein